MPRCPAAGACEASSHSHTRRVASLRSTLVCTPRARSSSARRCFSAASCRGRGVPPAGASEELSSSAASRRSAPRASHVSLRYLYASRTPARFSGLGCSRRRRSRRRRGVKALKRRGTLFVLRLV
ncbi:hypothetical protein E2C01_077111 [Portunus trituberculatus]|uniref:Uncharacterized protein n=1 Tax=Portunus trituberculatus TaxID=210409 RepID=A0A5B7IJH2_PORTR|nr:hypothetical protein [Portunus trituberculatus]